MSNFFADLSSEVIYANLTKLPNLIFGLARRVLSLSFNDSFRICISQKRCC